VTSGERTSQKLLSDLEEFRRKDPRKKAAKKAKEAYLDDLKDALSNVNDVVAAHKKRSPELFTRSWVTIPWPRSSTPRHPRRASLGRKAEGR
jgi:hypothetical protein